MNGIDKIGIESPFYYDYEQALMVASVWDYHAGGFEEFNPLSRGQRNEAFIKPIGVTGVVLRCYRPKRRGVELATYRVKGIELNPSAFESWPEFRRLIEMRLNPTILERGAPVYRLDCAIDVDRPTDVIARGLHWEGRRRLEDYNLDTPNTTQEYVVGAHPHSVAVYDRARKLRRAGLSAPEGPLSRVEIRLMNNSLIPPEIQTLTNLNQILTLTNRIRTRQFNPFEAVHVYSLSLPPAPTFDEVSRRYIGRHISHEERANRVQDEVGRWYEVNGIMRIAKYPVFKGIMQREYPDIWERVEHSELDLQGLLIDGIEQFYPIRERRRAADNEPRPLDMAA